MILERDWMLSIAIVFINVANIAFAFRDCGRNVFKNMSVCKPRVLLKEFPSV